MFILLSGKPYRLAPYLTLGMSVKWPSQRNLTIQFLILSGHMYDSFLSLKDYAQQPVSFPCKCNAPSAALCLQAFLYPHTD